MKLTKKFLEDNLRFYCDKISFNRKKGAVTFKKAYFYRCGQDAYKFCEKIKKQLEVLNLNFQIVDTNDNWNTWPKTSYFEVEIKFEEEK